jgi:hypothetical protein
LGGLLLDGLLWGGCFWVLLLGAAFGCCFWVLLLGAAFGCSAFGVEQRFQRCIKALFSEPALAAEVPDLTQIYRFAPCP